MWGHPGLPHFTDVEARAQIGSHIVVMSEHGPGGSWLPNPVHFPLLLQWPPWEGFLWPFRKILCKLMTFEQNCMMFEGQSACFDKHSKVLRTRCLHRWEGVSWEQNFPERESSILSWSLNLLKKLEECGGSGWRQAKVIRKFDTTTPPWHLGI